MTGPMGRRVRKFDGAFGPEGCGIALSGDEYEVSVTDLPFYIIRYDRNSADRLAALATPYPAAPDFSTGKRVTRFSGRFAPLQHGYHRLTIFCASLRSFKICSLV